MKPWLAARSVKNPGLLSLGVGALDAAITAGISEHLWTGELGGEMKGLEWLSWWFVRGEATEWVGLRGLLQAPKLSPASKFPHEHFTNLTTRRGCHPSRTQTLPKRERTQDCQSLQLRIFSLQNVLGIYCLSITSLKIAKVDTTTWKNAEQKHERLNNKYWKEVVHNNT